MASRLRRSLSRSLGAARVSLSKSAITLRTPRLWPWRKIAIGAGVVAAASAGIVVHEHSRQQRLQQERVFNEGSPLQAIESSLRTGDVLLFSRSPFGIDTGATSSWHPLRIAVVIAQKLAGGSAHDHAAMVVVRNDYPYVLERDWGGQITLRPFEARLLHSSAHEVILRRLEGPPPSEADIDRVEAWVSRLVGEEGNAAAAAAATANTAAASSSSPATAASPSASVSSTPSRVSPLALLRHLGWASLFKSAATTSSARSSPLVTLGQLTELWAEMQVLALRIQELQLKEEAAAAAAAAAAASARDGPSTSRPSAAVISSRVGSTNTLQRLQVRQKEVLNRLSALSRQLRSYDEYAPEEQLARDERVERVCDFPSAALVARGLQVLGVLPDSTRDEDIVLTLQPGRSEPASPTAASSLAQLPSLAIRIPASHVPPISAYAPKHFLSVSHVPLVHMHTLLQQRRAREEEHTSSAPITLPEVVLHREMFLKTPHKPLPFTRADLVEA